MDINIVDYQSVYNPIRNWWMWSELNKGEGFYPPQGTGTINQWRHRASIAGRDSKRFQIGFDENDKMIAYRVI